MDTKRIIRPAQLAEIPLILQMSDYSRGVMRANGNNVQWPVGYPSCESFRQDIESGSGFMIEEMGSPIAYFALVHGEEPTYRVIYDGQWMDDTTPYATIHRLCCMPGYHSVGRTCFEWCKTQAACLRSDTHEVNLIMRHIISSQGFTHCGTIIISDGAPRLAFQLLTYPMVDPSLKEYIESRILPQYTHFDTAHQLPHVQTVMAQSMLLCSHYPQMDKNMVYAIAAYHDLGLSEGRDTHHLVSGRIVRQDDNLTKWFSSEQIETMAQAVEDHRASAQCAPRSLYGSIVAEADRDIQPITILRRTIQYGLAHCPELDKEGHWKRTLQHLDEKYAPGGYLKLLIPESRNKKQLELLWGLIEDKAMLREHFDTIFEQELNQ